MLDNLHNCFCSTISPGWTHTSHRINTHGGAKAQTSRSKLPHCALQLHSNANALFMHVWFPSSRGSVLKHHFPGNYKGILHIQHPHRSLPSKTKPIAKTQQPMSMIPSLGKVISSLNYKPGFGETWKGYQANPHIFEGSQQ